jgi:hypothetical protein
MKHFFTLLIILFPIYGNAQDANEFENSYEEYLVKNMLERVDSTFIYVNDGDSQELFYYTISPKDHIYGSLVLFPSTWETAESVIENNLELIKIAHSKDILIVIPSINYNLYLDGVSLSFLNATFQNLLEKYAPPSDKFVFGGFSLGGMNAIRYTEMAYENQSTTLLKPLAVYGVDPPLDYERLYNSFLRSIEKNYSDVAMAEAEDYIQHMNQKFGGPPEDFRDVYIQYSMYSKSQKDGGNAKYLASIPIRIYCDPDIDWQLTERRMDLSDMNAFDQTAMINHLLLMGNKDAEFINALGKGYRLDGRRHPHSWSLVDPKECVDWILSCLK